ncbi:MAG: DUF533 domain-containing protein [Planctomycetales bacterium]|nr:DUF533 domain-containing protein [Planctomycetales bacterium]
MDAIDILGGLLGGKGGGGSLGGKILKDLIGGAKSTNMPSVTPKDTRGSAGPTRDRRSLEERAQELEDLLGVAKNRQTNTGHQMPPSSRQPQSVPQAQVPQAHDRGFTFPEVSPRGGRSPGSGTFTPELSANEQAIVLIRAMIQAAKADGQITQDEQQAIIARLGTPTQESVAFLREEFSRVLSARDFAWSVPLGLEQQVYTISLSAIDLDSNSEANYLRELAHGLRLTPEFCNELHSRYGVPVIN